MNKQLFTVAVVSVALALTMTALAGGGDDSKAAPEDSGYVGLAIDDAIVRAEAEGRPWRIARQDDEHFALTADLRPGRITFEIDDGVVTVAGIEQEAASPDRGPGDAEKRAGLLAGALLRFVTIDNGFGAQDVFSDFRVLSTIGDEPLTAIDRDFIEAVLSELGTVSWIDDFDAEVRPMFDAPPVAVVVLAIDRLELLDDRAEVELRSWCGSLCGVFLTYGAVPGAAGWEITGTVGPIAIS